MTARSITLLRTVAAQHMLRQSGKPRVILIGWLGAQQRHFVKYAQLWHRLGHPTMGVRPLTRDILLPLLCDRAAAKFVQQLTRCQAENPQERMLFHVFSGAQLEVHAGPLVAARVVWEALPRALPRSLGERLAAAARCSNAGFIFLGTCLRLLALQSPGLRGQLLPVPQWPDILQQPSKEFWGGAQPSVPTLMQPAVGVVIDSAPSRLTPDIAARGFTAAVLGRPAADIEEQHPVLVKAAQAAFRPVLGFGPISTRQREIWHSWQIAAPVAPQLYLHSTCDALIPPSEVQLFRQMQESRGLWTATKEFPDSPHVEHFRYHPEEYTEQLHSFVKAVSS